jgi:methylmalonyl-CoA/ethylmalonyl-CoA epimerase
MIKSLDHVAIAVPELDEAIRRFAEDLGVTLDHVEDVPAAQTTTAFLPIAGPTTIELVTPLAGAGPIAKALDTRGPGLHHLCFRTDDLDGDVARLREKGWRFTTEQPSEGAHGTRVMWVHPKSGGGVLIELAEHPEDRAARSGAAARGEGHR